MKKNNRETKKKNRKERKRQRKKRRKRKKWIFFVRRECGTTGQRHTVAGRMVENSGCARKRSSPPKALSSLAFKLRAFFFPISLPETSHSWFLHVFLFYSLWCFFFFLFSFSVTSLSFFFHFFFFFSLCFFFFFFFFVFFASISILR